MRKISQRKCNDKNISYKNSYTSFDDKVTKVNAFDHIENSIFIQRMIKANKQYIMIVD